MPASDNSQTVSEYINNRLDQRKLVSELNNVEQQITSLETLIKTDAKYIAPHLALQLKKKDLDKGIKKLNDPAPELRKTIAETYRDELYAAYLDSEISKVEIGLIRNGNRPSIVDRIRRLANSDWDVRQPSGGLPSKVLEQPSNRLRAQYYIDSLNKEWAAKKLAKAEAIKAAMSPDDPEKLQIEKVIETTQEVITKTEEGMAAKTIVADKKEVDPPLAPAQNKDVSDKDLKGQVKAVKEDSVTISLIPAQVSSENLATETPISDFVPTVIESPIIEPTVTSNVLSVLDPLEILSFNKTQRLDTDIIDPREVEIIIPPSFNYPLPAYIFVKDITGAPPIEDRQSDPLTKEQRSKIPTLENIFKPNSNIPYNQFSVRAIGQNYGEKFQIDETLGEGLAIFGFGKKPKIWQISGTLLNDLVNKWKTKFEYAYDNHFRLSILIKKNAYLYIAIPAAGVKFSCYPVQLDITTDSSSEGLSIFTMSVIVRDYSQMLDLTISKDMQRIVKAISEMNPKVDNYNLSVQGKAS